MNEIEIQFELNGESRRASVTPELLLADFLRGSLGLKGTKTSCEVEVCGACTVLLDGRPVSACATLTHEINGRSLTTIEGLGDGERTAPGAGSVLGGRRSRVRFLHPRHDPRRPRPARRESAPVRGGHQGTPWTATSAVAPATSPSSDP